MNKQTLKIGEKMCTIFADPEPQVLLIQPSGEHEASALDNEVSHIKMLTDTPFAFAAFSVTNWNSELSPWECPPVFGDEAFGNGAVQTLTYIEDILLSELARQLSLNTEIPVILGGYSLAGLFTLWAGYTSDRFIALAGVSPSVWFPRWRDFIEDHQPFTQNVYLSLGRKEEKTRNKVMAAVGENICRQAEILESSGTNVALEWNDGNHFTEPDIRTAKGFAWCLNELGKNMQ